MQWDILFYFILFYFIPNVDGEISTTVLLVLFWIGSNSKRNLSICRALNFPLDISTHPSETDEELLYYRLYHEEAPFYPDVCTQLFNRTFIIFMILSSQ